SEAAYYATGYKRWDLATAALAGALAAPGAIALDALLFGEIATSTVVALWTIGATISGAIYGSVGYGLSVAVRR
ncbi:MAG: ABC transporter permease, partial [Desulfurococcales archaeon]|nr:ABC transporter permease [Desulfurococcales archaeon]